MMRKILFMILITMVFAVTPAIAENPKTIAITEPGSGMACLTEMKDVFEPARSSLRKVVISAVNEKGEKIEFFGAHAYKAQKDMKKMLLIILKPEPIKGVAYLFLEKEKKPSEVWVYLPAVRRARKLGPVEGSEPFLGTDFTYSDIGLIPLPKQCDLLEVKDYEGGRAYRVKEKASEETKLYYSNIVTWVDTKSFLPLKREYYDPAGILWKTELFKEFVTIDNITAPLLIQMKDIRRGFMSEIKMSSVTYDVNIPDSLFNPSGLSEVLNSPIWKPYSN